MNALTLHTGTGRGTRFDLVRRLARELLDRERRLALYGALMFALLLPMALAWGLDDRALRGANVWIKPMKFALSTAVLAWTTAWFIGHLQAAHARSRAVDRIVWLLTAGWLHYLAFDLFVGSWISEQAAALALPHWLLLPPLALTFLFGPAGLLVFFGLRTVWRKRLPAPAIA